MEERLGRLEKMQERQVLIMDSFATGMEEQQAMIKEIRELVEQLKKLRS